MTIATAVPVGQGVGIGSCKSTARRKGGGRGGAKWKKKRSIRRRGLCGILPCEDKLTPPVLCPFGVVSSLCKCGNLLTVGCVQYIEWTMLRVTAFSVRVALDLLV